MTRRVEFNAQVARVDRLMGVSLDQAFHFQHEIAAPNKHHRSLSIG
jgi:hypothetical protein